MNTLSAKADSFSEHRTQQHGCAPLARSRPSALKYVKRRVLIPIHHESTAALMHANIQRFGHDLATCGAQLARISRVNSFYFGTGSLSLVFEYIDEARPCDIGNRPSMPAALDHSLDVQAFHSDFAIAGNYQIRNLVPVLVAQVRDTGVKPGNFAPCLLAIGSAEFLAGNRTLCAAKRTQRLLEIFRVLNLLAFRGCEEALKANIDPDSRKAIRNPRHWRLFSRDYKEPLSALALEAERLNFPLDFAVQAYPHHSDVLDAKAVSFEPDSVAMARVENRVKPIGGLEARVARFLASLFAGLNVAEEIRERLIQPAERALSAAKIDSGEPSVLWACFSEPPRLIFVAAGDFPLTVKPTPLRQRRIVKPPVRFEHDAKFALLIRVRPKPEFVRLETHSRTLLLLIMDIFYHFYHAFYLWILSIIS